MVRSHAPAFEHVELSGRVIRCVAPNAQTSAFLERAQNLAALPRTTPNEMRAFVFSSDNPIMARHPTLPGAYPDEATVKDPLYWVCVDLIQRVELRACGLPLERAGAPFTTSVSEAAARLSRHRQAIHNAVNNRTLHAWMHDGRLYLLPAEVAAYDVPRRGRPHRQKQ
ncbi:MAG: hypothetical protein ACOY0T_31065 [Myxococcota bacterium]